MNFWAWFVWGVSYGLEGASPPLGLDAARRIVEAAHAGNWLSPATLAPLIPASFFGTLVRLAEQMPQIVEAAAKPFGAIKDIVVFDGAEGFSKFLSTAVGMGTVVLPKLMSALRNGGGHKGE